MQSAKTAKGQRRTAMGGFYVYILKMRDNRLYVGHTNSLSRRHTEHERGKGSRTTDIFGAGEIIYIEEQPDRVSAARREKQIKGWTQAKKIALATGNMGKLHSLAKRHSR